MKDEFDVNGLSLISRFGVLASCSDQISRLQLALNTVKSCEEVFAGAKNLKSLTLDTQTILPRETIRIPKTLDKLTLLDGDCVIDGRECDLTELKVVSGKPVLILGNTQ